MTTLALVAIGAATVVSLSRLDRRDPAMGLLVAACALAVMALLL